MASKVTPRKVKKSLRVLGRTPKQVAESLQGLGIVGYVGDAKQCPIARYLRYKFDSLGYVGVGGGIATVDQVSVLTGPTVDDFIRSFDRREFPELLP